ncbi:MAG: 6-phosphogluconolactonase [Chlorobi bacterium]|nr:6-phosphogluconolactonase [Chlorobiota bacterium]
MPTTIGGCCDMPTPTSHLRIFPDASQLFHAAAAEIAQMIANHNGERFRLVLSGGRTPEGVYQLLGTTFADAIPWGKVELFWGDDRYVPHHHPASNFGMVRRSLLERVPIPPGQVHPIPTSAVSPTAAATAYEEMLRRVVGGQGEVPRFDLLLLGMGDDGHTASLFPGGDWLAEESAWVVASRAPVPPHDRITLTFPLLNAARRTMILVTGETKRPILQEILDNPAAAATRYPIANLSPQGEVRWLIG